MRTLRRPGRLLSMVAAAAVLAGTGLLASCGDDDGPSGPGAPAVVPQSWAGIWNLTTTTRDCTTNEVLDQGTRLDTLCTGARVEDEFDLSELSALCPGTAITIDDTSLRITCNHTATDGECRYDVTIDGAATLNPGANTMSGSVRFTVSPSSESCGGAQCLELVVTGTRVSLDQPGCSGTAAQAGGLFRSLREQAAGPARGAGE